MEKGRCEEGTNNKEEYNITENKCAGWERRRVYNVCVWLILVLFTLSLGSVSHSAVLKALGYRLSEFKFSHGAKHALYKHNILLFDSYHTSRYNINTGVLTYEMFDEVIKKIKELIEND